MRNISFALPEVISMIDALRRTNGFQFGVSKTAISSMKKLEEARMKMVYPKKADRIAAKKAQNEALSQVMKDSLWQQLPN